MIKVVARHQSGHWTEVGKPSFFDNIDWMRWPTSKSGAKPSIVTRTEMTGFGDDLSGDGWGFYHPLFPGTKKPVDCSIEYDLEVWKVQDLGLRVLTDFRVTTAQSHTLLLPSSMPWVLLESVKQPNWLLLVSTAHNNLDNTPDRAHAWVEEGHTFRGFQKRRALTHRGLHRLHQADMNKDIRHVDQRMMVRNNFLNGTGMKWAWDTEKLPARGTRRGVKEIIDYSISNMQCKGTTRILTNTGFSDHNPLETIWEG